MKMNGKFLTAALLSGVMLCSSFTAFAVTQEAYQVSAKIKPQFTIEVDGDKTTFFDVSGNEVQPIVYNGTTYLPVRAIGELMGKNVNWDQNTLTVTIAGERTTAAVKGEEDENAKEAEVTVQIRPDFTIVVEGKKRGFADAKGNTAYALLYNGSTYLPLRAIGEMMGKNVLWIEDTQTVSLYGEASADSLVTDADTFNTAPDRTNGQTPDNQKNPPPEGNRPRPERPDNKPFEDGTMIGEEAARKKALEYADLETAENFRIKQKTEDGRQIYNVEFRDGNTTYEYDIDAYTGEVIESEKESKIDKKNNVGAEVIGEEKARSIALSEVSGAEDSDIVKIKLDDDSYEVKIIFDGTEYKIEINAYTGEIEKLESELSE